MISSAYCPDAHCRVRVTGYKTPKGTIKLIPRAYAEWSREAKAALQRNAKVIADPDRDLSGLAGFVIVAWEFDGTFHRCYRNHQASPITRTLMPSYVADVLRQVTAAENALELMKGNDFPA